MSPASTAIKNTAKNGLSYLDFLAWWLWLRRPKLGRRRASKHLTKLGYKAAAPSHPKDVNLLVHIAFHFSPNRWKFLDETVRQISSLPIKNIDIIIDTNYPITKWIASLKLPRVKVQVWPQLDDPFKLTWVHRDSIKSNIGNYDIFLYLEDDILIPTPAIEYWLSEVDKLSRRGYLPGFIRVEEDRAGDLVLSDFQRIQYDLKIIDIEGNKYLASPFPYQACWICNNEEIIRFAQSPNFWTGAHLSPRQEKMVPLLGVRERMAVGSIFEDPPPNLPSRSLVPLTDNLRISPSALIFHMPSNYGRRKQSHEAGLGTIKLDDLRIEDAKVAKII